MNFTLILDNTLRLLFSFFYRIILTVAGFFILLTNENNQFPINYYIFYFIIYSLIFYWCYRKKGFLSILRLVNDFAFIYFFAYGKEIDNIGIFTFVFLPIFNSPNHSSYKRSLYLPFLLTYVLLFFLNQIQNLLIGIIPFVALFILDNFEHLRSRMIRFNNALLTELDQYLHNGITLMTPPALYKSLIDFINNSKYLHVFLLEDVICFSIDKKNVFFLNSFNFIFKINLTLEEEQFELVNNQEIVENISLSIDENIISGYVGFPVKFQNSHYLFLVKIREKNAFLFILLKNILFQNLHQIFNKIVKYLETAKDLEELRKKSSEEYSNNLAFINETIFALHFVKNKLNPIKNYFQFFVDLEKSEDEESKEVWNTFIQKEFPRAKECLEMIVSKSNQVTDTSANPYYISNFNVIDIVTLILLVRKIWNHEFQSENIFYVDIEENLRNTISINENAFEILISDIVANIKKYKNRDASLKFEIINNDFIIKFDNDFVYKAETNNSKDLKKLAADFNSGKILEVKQKNHGLSTIKTFSDQMKIDSLIIIEKGVFSVILKFKIL